MLILVVGSISTITERGINDEEIGYYFIWLHSFNKFGRMPEDRSEGINKEREGIDTIRNKRAGCK